MTQAMSCHHKFLVKQTCVTMRCHVISQYLAMLIWQIRDVHVKDYEYINYCWH